MLKISPKNEANIKQTNPGNYKLPSKWIPCQNAFLQQRHKSNQVKAGTLCYNVLQIHNLYYRKKSNQLEWHKRTHKVIGNVTIGQIIHDFWSATVSIALSCNIFQLFDIKEYHDYEIWLEVTQGNSNSYHSKAWERFKTRSFSQLWPYL